MSRLAVFLLLASIALPLGAAPKTLDYAFEAALEPSEQPLQRIELPLEILLVLTRDDLGDLAVFNARGKPLPCSVIRAPDSEIPATLELPFHEFSRFLDRHSKTVTTREQNHQPGALTERETYLHLIGDRHPSGSTHVLIGLRQIILRQYHLQS